MKHLKTFKNYKFKKGALVKLTSEAIDDFIFNITKYSHKYPKTQIITKEELKNKIFYISKIEELSSVDDDTVEYNLINIDPDDKFFWGGTSENSIKLLTQEEKKDFELKLATKKYNI